jgi:hypothetical protein
MKQRMGSVYRKMIYGRCDYYIEYCWEINCDCSLGRFHRFVISHIETPIKQLESIYQKVTNEN